VDGTGAAARFQDPWGLAIDGAGNVFVADRGNYRVRKITSTGIVSTLGGGSQGLFDGPGVFARFSSLYGVAADSSGSVYVADQGNNRIRKVASDGTTTTFARDFTRYAGSISGVAVDGAGNVFVAAYNEHAVYKISPAGSVSVLAGNLDAAHQRTEVRNGDPRAYADGPGVAALFNEPFDLGVDAAGNVFIADYLNHRIRRISPQGTVTTLLGGDSGRAEGTISATKFTNPIHLSVDAARRAVLVGDETGRLVRVRVTPMSEESGPGWLSLSSSSGTGSGSLSVTVAGTNSVEPRSAIVYVDGQAIPIEQAGQTATLTVAPSSVDVFAAGGSAVLTITSSAGDAAWTALSSEPWLTLSAAGGTGSGTVTITASPTTSGASRSATVTIAGRIVTVTQSGGALTVAPATWAPLATGGSLAVSVTATSPALGWSASSSAGWLTISSASGTGSTEVTLTAAATTSVAPRSATVTVAGRTVAVTQAAGVNTFSVTPTAIVLPGVGGSTSLALSASLADAPWTATNGATWVTVSSGSGVGSAGLTLLAEAQAPYAPQRSATVSVAGLPIVVTQQATTEPGPPRQLSASVEGTRVVFRWAAPDSGGPLGFYLLEYGFAPGRTDGASLNVGTVREFAVNVPPGRFFIRLKAQNTYGVSPASNEIEVRMGIGGEPPGRPQALTTSVSGASVNLSWTAPAGGDPPTGYQLEAGSGPGLANIASIPLGFDTSIAFDGIPPGLYYVRVRGINSFGVGAPSEDEILAVGGTAEPPQRPTGLLATVSGSMVSFRWNAPTTGGTPAGYVVEAGTGVGLSDITTVPLVNQRTFSVDGVPAGVYYVRVRATNALGASAPSNEVTVNVGAGDQARVQTMTADLPGEDTALRPGPPSQLRGMVTGRTVWLRWDGPQSHAAITGYRVEVAAHADGSAIWSAVAPEPTFTVTGVPPGVYYVRVLALRPTSVSAPSNVLMVVVP